MKIIERKNICDIYKKEIKRTRKARRKEYQRLLEKLYDESVEAKVKPEPLSSLFGFAAIIQSVTPKPELRIRF